MDQGGESPAPVLVPLGERALLVRFADRLTDAANRRAVAFARALEAAPPEGVEEIAPNLVSVLVRFDPLQTDPDRLAGALRLLLWEADAGEAEGREHEIVVRFGGEDGPDLAEAAALAGLAPEAFVARHNAEPLRVLAIGFAPGFCYCGFHTGEMVLKRRTGIRPQVPAGSVLFAAGQTAIAATPVRTGWHVIGRTEFRNFDPGRVPPTRLTAGDLIRFVAA